MNYPNPEVVNWLWDRPPGHRWFPLDLMRAYVIPMVISPYEIIGFTGGVYLLRCGSTCYIAGVCCGEAVRAVAGRHGFLLRRPDDAIDFLTIRESLPVRKYGKALHPIDNNRCVSISGGTMRFYDLKLDGPTLDVRSEVAHRWRCRPLEPEDIVIGCSMIHGEYRATIWRGRNIYHWSQNEDLPELILILDEDPLDVFCDSAGRFVRVLFPLGRLQWYK